MRAIILVLLCVPLAACIKAGPQEGSDGASRNGLQIALGDEPGARTTAAAPQWSTGEWWRYRVTDTTGKAHDVTRVVAGRDGDTYVVGMPVEEWNHEVISFHLPGFGDVRADDLAYEVHDGYYQLLRFPLVEGDSWSAWFEFGNVTVRVDSVDARFATVVVEDARSAAQEAAFGPGFSATARYDAALGEIAALDVMGYGSFEVVDHGVGWEGTMRAPRAQDLVFHATGGQFAQGGTGLTDEVAVGAKYDGLVLVLAAGARAVQGTSSSAYCAEKATSPAGEVFETTAAPPNAELRSVRFDVAEPTGIWRFEHTRAGLCIAQSEGFAYESHEITIPGLHVARPIR